MKRKSTKGRKGARYEQGSVMMETVIAIPIFLVVLGATLWLGDLNLGRSQLITGDRYAAWNAGNRHGGADYSRDSMWQRFFGSHPDQRVRYVAARVRDAGWYREVKGQVTTTFTIPQWTRGLLNAGWDTRSFDRSMTMTGRDKPHLIVMRGGAIDDGMDKVNWIDVKNDGWWPRRRLGGRSPRFAMTKQYERFGQYVGWSE